MNSKTKPSLEFITSILAYEPETGIFRWKYREGGPSSWNSRHAGKVAGNITLVRKSSKSVRIRIRVGHESFYAHRLAWLIMTSEWPESIIDHIDGDGSNNRFSNLRLCTNQQNQWNRKVGTASLSGIKCIQKKKNGRWYAYICQDGKHKSLGGYASSDEARTAYINAAKSARGEFARW